MKRYILELESLDDLSKVLLVSDLKATLECLQDDLEKRKAGTGMAIFHKDKKKDIAEIKRHIEAVKLVLQYYGDPV